MVRTGKVRELILQENLKSGTVQKTETYQYLRKPRRTCKGNNKKMRHNSQGSRCYRGKESSWERGDKG